MRKLLKFLLVSALILFIGLPAAFLVFVLGMAALGVAIGIGGAIIGMMFTVLKIALMVILPIVIVVWIAKALLKPQRTY